MTSRERVCTELAFSDDSQEPDLMNPNITSDRLIVFLEQLLAQRGGIWGDEKLIVTAVKSDHPTNDGPNGHSGGNAIDFSQNGPDNAVVHLVKDVQACQNALGIELNGPFMAAADACGGYSEQSKLFPGEPGNDHIHVQVMGY